MGFISLATGVKAVADEEATTTSVDVIIPVMLDKRFAAYIPEVAIHDLRPGLERGLKALGGVATWKKLKTIVLSWLVQRCCLYLRMAVPRCHWVAAHCAWCRG